jgi:hypothetical protein
MLNQERPSLCHRSQWRLATRSSQHLKNARDEGVQLCYTEVAGLSRIRIYYFEILKSNSAGTPVLFQNH